MSKQSSDVQWYQAVHVSTGKQARFRVAGDRVLIYYNGRFQTVPIKDAHRTIRSIRDQKGHVIPCESPLPRRNQQALDTFGRHARKAIEGYTALSPRPFRPYC